MTTSIVWPATLPCFRFEPYTVAPRPGSTEMTVGMVTRRAMVYRENNELVSVEMVLSSAQEQALRTFFKTGTVMGTQSFIVDLLIAGTYEQREANFYGAPPTFIPVAPNYVRSAFQLLTRTQVIAEPGPPPPLEYDPIVLARSPDGYWRLDESSGTSFTDLSGNGRNITYTGSNLTYSNPTLNLDGGLSLGRDSGAVNWFFGVDVTSEMDADPEQSLTVGGWVKFYNTAPTEIKTLFHIGGSSGGGQFYKLWAYRNASGFVEFGYHHLLGGFRTKTFTTALSLDTPFWYECGISFPNLFFKLNGGSAEVINPGVDTPNGIDPGRGTSWFQIGRRPAGNDGDAINGQFSHTELYLGRVESLDMWPDWHL